MRKKAKPDKDATLCVKEFAERLAKHATQFAFDAILDISDRQHEGLGGVALLKAASEGAKEAGALAGKAAMLELITSDLLGVLANAARSQGAKKAGGAVKRRSGGKKSPWRASAKAVLKKRRNLDVSTDELIESLINNLVIDQDGEGFYCHETGDRIAKSKKNLASEISKLKSEVPETRASTGK